MWMLTLPLCNLWSMSYKKDSKRRHLEKMDNDLSNLMTPEMVNEYERSEAARSAVDLLEQPSGAHSLQVNQSMYTLVRDFVLLEITIANAHHSGVLANMTLEEYKAAKRVDDSNGHQCEGKQNGGYSRPGTRSVVIITVLVFKIVRQ